ncbi:hypothetical protein CXF72_17735 [Psychromonas sp. MB-3u-54]|uniref:DUF3465 domain-containing protein n=1 Tax=Psychromonas sp. MB-3u-54 TaxID=2058319 RepID=UPI000C34CBC6|nr:DUF3465 domain-containing protein [Psychromonas sp. MB-3u-54]PKH01254.1 hypothetical protein CXF72_17735 [Psychromonas sp. MB-3u-54]
MKRMLASIIVLLSILSLPVWGGDADLKQVYEARQSDIQVQGKGEVIKILADDTDGAKHQRFILRLVNHQTILLSHNIDLAPRISNLKAGDWVEFYGEYEWNSKGGVVHWTHQDPRHSHAHGWLKHRNKKYN